MTNYHPSGCEFTRGECLHPNDKCSECNFLYSLWKDELAPYFDSAYEKGFADGVRDFAEWVLRSPKLWQEDYMLLADVETLVKDYEEATKGGENE